MAADTYDPILGLILQGTGNNNNAWGTIQNNSMVKLAARSIAGMRVITTAGGTLDLSGSPPPATARQDLDMIQYINGTLTQHLYVVVPSIYKMWLFSNNTGGAFHVYVRGVSGGIWRHVPQGTTKLLWCDGTNVNRTDMEEVGAIRISGKAGQGAGELLCYGQSVLRSDYPDLFAQIGGTWGAADGTHFTMPDFWSASRFLRSAGAVGGVGIYQGSCNLSHTHTGSGTTSTVSSDHSHTYSGGAMSGAADRSLDHLHVNAGYNRTAYTSGGFVTAAGINYIDYNNQHASGAMDRSIDHLHGFNWSGTTSGISANHTHTYSFTTSTGSADGGEARPTCVSVLMCIKF